MPLHATEHPDPPAQLPMKIALHTGKGGVGKTTISAVTAIAAARAGRRTLLLSADPAHSVADVLDQPIGADPTPVAGIRELCAAQVDTRGRFEQGWSAVRSYLVDVLAARGIAAVQAEELTVLPGAEEIVALLELQAHAAGGEFDAIVLDCAPTGETLRLLALPETLSFYAERMMGTPARLLRVLAGGLTSGLATRRGNRPVSGQPAPGQRPATGTVRDALGELLDRLAEARELLTDPEITGVRLVMTAERVVVAEARRLYTALSLHGYTVPMVLVNRLLPPGPADALLDGWRRAQEAALVTVGESFGHLPIRRLPLAHTEPVGIGELTRLAGELFGDADPFDDQLPGPQLATTDQGERFQLRIFLPLADRGAVDLARSGDDLVITAGAERRRLALPSLLQRCRTSAAHFDGDHLVVDFEADPDRWPQTLLAQAGR